MSIANVIPELWSTQLLIAFRNSHVFNSLVNRNYEGEIRNAGDTVKITTPAAITTGAYSGSVTYQEPTTAQQSLTIDQQLYWAFKLADVDQAQANVNTMQMYMQESAYSLADAVDADLAGLYTESGLDDISLDVGTDDFYDKLVEAGKQLSEANVPKQGRWVVVTPKGHSDLLKNDAFIHATQRGDDVIANGMVGRAAGFTVFESNNVVNSSSNTYKYLYGTNAAITVAEQVIETEAVRLESSFHDAMRGLLVYGRRVVRPSALGVITADETP